MMQITLAALLGGVCLLIGCTANLPREAPSTDQKYVGEKRYASHSRQIQVCETPRSYGHLPKCVSTSGGFTVEKVENIAGTTHYWVRTDDERTGYIHYLDFMIAKSEKEHQARVAEAKECDRKGGVRIGMTAAQVLASCWGKPRKVNTTVTASGSHEQWVYGSNYVYVDNGIVRSIQTSE